MCVQEGEEEELGHLRYACVCVCVCVGERERVCVCVCMRERADRKGGRERGKVWKTRTRGG